MSVLPLKSPHLTLLLSQCQSLWLAGGERKKKGERDRMGESWTTPGSVPYLLFIFQASARASPPNPQTPFPRNSQPSICWTLHFNNLLCLTWTREVIVQLQTRDRRGRFSLFLLPRIAWDLQVTYLDSPWLNNRGYLPFLGHISGFPISVPLLRLLHLLGTPSSLYYNHSCQTLLLS